MISIMYNIIFLQIIIIISKFIREFHILGFKKFRVLGAFVPYFSLVDFFTEYRVPYFKRFLF